jgi:hypothetical protein
MGCTFGLRCPVLTFYFLKNTGGKAIETRHDVVITLQHEWLPPKMKPMFTLKPWKLGLARLLYGGIQRD